MTKIRVTKKFDFEMAHALNGYDGICRSVHGHSYKLDVTVIGEPVIDHTNVKLGMVIDFSDFKRIVKEHIVDVYDHSLILNYKENINAFEDNKELFKRVHIVKFQPTCENLIIYFSEILIKYLPANVKLHSIKLHETANSFAEWYEGDQ